MIHYRGVTEGEDQGWSVAKVILCGAEIFGKGRTPWWLGTLELPEQKCPQGEEQFLEWLRSESF